jgi:hypothetical protein
MKQIVIWITLFAIMVGLCAYTGYVCRTADRAETVHAPVEPIPMRKQIQRRLKDAGYYHGKIDGIIGPESNKAWGRAECQQYANEHEVK